MSFDHYFTLHTKVNLKWIKDLNVRSETIKLLEENVGGKLLDISLGYDLEIDTKSKGKKSKNKQVGLPQTNKKLYTANEIINKMRKQPLEWKKIFANHISNKKLISKIYKELLQLNSKKKPHKQKQKPN